MCRKDSGNLTNQRSLVDCEMKNIFFVLVNETSAQMCVSQTCKTKILCKKFSLWSTFLTLASSPVCSSLFEFSYVSLAHRLSLCLSAPSGLRGKKWYSCHKPRMEGRSQGWKDGGSHTLVAMVSTKGRREEGRSRWRARYLRPPPVSWTTSLESLPSLSTVTV